MRKNSRPTGCGEKQEITNGLLGADSIEGISFFSLVSPNLRKEDSGQGK